MLFLCESAFEVLIIVLICEELSYILPFLGHVITSLAL